MRALVLIGALAAGAFTAPATAQIINPAAVDYGVVATKAEVQAVQSIACPPGSTTPQAEAVTATAGSSTTCLRSDARLPRITRAGVVSSTDANGSWSITWSTPLPTVPVTLPLPVNTGTQPIVCNVASSTTTGATGRCWLARTLPATILTLTALVSFDPNGAAASGISVQVLAIPMTQ